MNVSVAVCIPEQLNDRDLKLAWLDSSIGATKDAGDLHLFLTPQEFFGGHVTQGDQPHVSSDWINDKVSKIASKHSVAIGVGAAVTHPTGGATEDFIYFGPDGTRRGHHRKFALPAYDDVRSKGAGALWPETSFRARTTPVRIAEFGLVIGTVFCWEVFNQAIWPAYSFAGVNMVAHPIKFAPRGWLKLDRSTGTTKVVGFAQDAKSNTWIDRLIFASRHQVMCPIFASCNTWNLGEKFKALAGMVDEVGGRTELIELPSLAETNMVRTFEFNPGFYSGIDSLYSGGAFKEVAGSIEGFSSLKPWTMHAKVRRLESQLIGGTALLDSMLLASTQRQQKSSSLKRARKRLGRKSA